MQYLAVYESSTRNAISRCLREQHKKCNISLFTRAAQEKGHLVVYEISTKKIPRYLRHITRNEVKMAAKKLLGILGVIAERRRTRLYALL